MDIKIKSVKALEGWAAEFAIGVQSFSLASRDTKEEADWYCKQLKTAFENIVGDRVKIKIKTNG